LAAAVLTVSSTWTRGRLSRASAAVQRPAGFLFVVVWGHRADGLPHDPTEMVAVWEHRVDGLPHDAAEMRARQAHMRELQAESREPRLVMPAEMLARPMELP